MSATCKYCGAEWKAGGEWHSPICPVVTGKFEEWTRAKRKEGRKERQAREQAYLAGLDPLKNPYDGSPWDAPSPPAPAEES